MDSTSAQSDLDFIKQVVDRSSQQIDAHAFHTVHWGLLVLIWYPLANYFQHQENYTGYVAVGIIALVLGSVVSTVRELKMSKSARLPAGNTLIASQFCRVTVAFLVCGMVLSAAAPASRFIAGQNVPIIWGLVYAFMALMYGIVYAKDYLFGGILIFVAAVVAMFLSNYCGYILGPAMGAGMIIPGLRAERRVRRLIAASSS